MRYYLYSKTSTSTHTLLVLVRVYSTRTVYLYSRDCTGTVLTVYSGLRTGTRTGCTRRLSLTVRFTCTVDLRYRTVYTRSHLTDLARASRSTKRRGMHKTQKLCPSVSGPSWSGLSVSPSHSKRDEYLDRESGCSQHAGSQSGIGARGPSQIRSMFEKAWLGKFRRRQAKFEIRVRTPLAICVQTTVNLSTALLLVLYCRDIGLWIVSGRNSWGCLFSTVRCDSSRNYGLFLTVFVNGSCRSSAERTQHSVLKLPLF